MTAIRATVMCVVWAIAAIALAACDSGDASPTPTPTPTVAVSPTLTPTEPPATATPSLEEIADEVAEAYLAYWDAYAEAVLNLDASLVEGFAAGEELESIREEIEELRAEGVAMRVVVEHDFAVVDVTSTDAIVIDELVNNSFTVDPETKEPPEAEGSGNALRDTVTLELIDGRWVVVSGTRESRE
ncbi:MAG: hypothetical protein KC461_03665 [Dehalococcoidia bacterium]|nr:hypothetical protein [Dehalococcoidia bacterium]